MTQKFRDTFNEIKKYEMNLTSLTPQETQALIAKMNELTSLREDIAVQYNNLVEEIDFLLEKLQSYYSELKRNETFFSGKDTTNDIVFENLFLLEELIQLKRVLAPILNGDKGTFPANAFGTDGVPANGNAINGEPSFTQSEKKSANVLNSSPTSSENTATDVLTNGVSTEQPVTVMMETEQSMSEDLPVSVKAANESETAHTTVIKTKTTPPAPVITREREPKHPEKVLDVLIKRPVKELRKIQFQDLPFSEQVARTDFSNIVLLETEWLEKAVTYMKKNQQPNIKSWLKRMASKNNKEIPVRLFRTAINEYIRLQEEMRPEEGMASQTDTSTGQESSETDGQDSNNLIKEMENADTPEPPAEEVKADVSGENQTPVQKEKVELEPNAPTENLKTEDAPAPVTEQDLPEQQQYTGTAMTEKVNEAIWNNLLNGEYAKAYWLSYHDESPLPPWLMKAFFYAGQVKENNETRKAAQELSTIVMEHPEPQSELTAAPYHLNVTETQLLITSVVAYTSLVAPNSYLYNWLAGREQNFSALESLQKAIYDYSIHNQSLLQDMHELRAAVSVQDLKSQLKDLSSKMKDRFEHLQSARFNYKPATLVFHHFINESHPIGELLELIIQNQSNRYNEIFDYVSKNLSDSKAITSLIESAYVKLKEIHIRKIEGRSQTKLIERMLELKDQFEEYAIIAQRLEEMKQNADWSNARVEDFKESFTSLINSVREELDSHQMKGNNSSQPYAILVSKVESVLEQISHVLKGEPLSDNGSANTPIKTLLTEPLLLLNDFPGDIYEPLPETLHSGDALQLLSVLESGKTFKEAFEHHIQEGDFTAASLIMETPSFVSTGDMREYRDQFNDQLLMKKQTFLIECDKIRYLIEHSTIEHILTESEQSDFEGELLSIEKSSNEQFPKLQNQLLALEDKINELRAYRKESLKNHLTEIVEEIPKIPKEHQKEALEYKRRTEARLEKGDIALADEYLAQLEHVIEEGPQTEPEESLDENYFKEFLNSHQQINGLLEEKYSISGNDLRRAKAANILNMKRVPKPRQKEAELWQQLVRINHHFPTLAPHVTAYMTFSS